MNLKAKNRALARKAVLRGKNTVLRMQGPLWAVLILLLSGALVIKKTLAEAPAKASPSNTISGKNSSVIWPLSGKPDFSSGFGDYRPGRFHYGLDLRTGDKRRPVLAPVSGYVWKVYVNYFGFGKALYLKGDNGNLYVMAHLDRFTPEIERVVKRIQLKKKLYFVQKKFDSTEFRVNQGDTICYTGKTGTKAPHLHFETRDSSNTPRSPLTVGFLLDDTSGPVFKLAIFEYRDTSSYFSHGSRRQTFAAAAAGKDENGARRFLLDKVPYFTAPTGILTTVRDYPTNNKFGASPRLLRLRIAEPPTAPDTLWEYELKYELTLDSLSYLEGDKSLCVYEQGYAQNGSKSCYWLFERDNNCIDSSSDEEQSVDKGRLPFRYGLYRARIEAADAVGNMSVLEFSYFNGPPGPLYDLIDVHEDYAIISPRNYDLVKALGISEIVVVEGRSRDNWRESERASIVSLESGAFRINFDPHVAESKRRLFAVLLKGIDGWRKRDVILSAYPGSNEDKISLSYELKERGLFVHARSSSLITTIPQIQLIDLRGSAINLSSRQVGPKEFVAFCPPSSVTDPIVGMRSFMFDQSQKAISDEKICFLVAAPSKGSTVRDSLATEKGTIFAPQTKGKIKRITELKLIRKRLPLRKSILAGPFLVGPDDFRYPQKTVLSMRPHTPIKSASNIAVCRLSDKDDKWEWFDTVSEGDVYSAVIHRNGIYALMVDKAPPIISSISPRNFRKIKSKIPTLTATIEDKLSGIWVDTLFDIRLDGEWLIPEYDAEDHILKTKPNRPLAAGAHNLVITVRDNAGNKARQSVKFIVK